MAETKLLPCPFCGGEGDHHDIGNAHTKSRGTKIWCKSCFFSKTVKAIRHDLDWTRAIAIAAWNSRPQASRIAELEKALNNVIEAAERSLGDHSAPHDCFATGPMTGNPIADLVACPGCVQVNEIAAARSVLSTQAAE